MTLRQKTLVALGATLLGLIALLYLAYSATVLRSFEQLEEETARDSVDQVVSALNLQAQNFGLQIRDWAQWDETYAYVAGENDAFVENLSLASFYNLRLSAMALVDLDGRVVYSRAYDLETQQEIEDISLQSYIDDHPRLLAHDGGPTDGWSGLLVIGETPMIVATSPILLNDGTGPAIGTLIWARFLDQFVLELLSSIVQAPVTLALLDEANPPTEITSLALSLDEPVAVRVMDSETVAAYALLPDLYGQPAMVLRVMLPREIYQHGQLSMSWFAWSLLIAGLIFGAVFVLLLERLILSRLAHISRTVEAISASRDLTARLDVQGNDELSKLVAAINTGLEATAESQAKLKALNEDLERRVAERTGDLERELLFQEAILDSMNEGVLYGTTDEIEYANRMMSELTGYEPHEFIGKPPSLLFSPPTRQERMRLFGGDPAREGWMQRGERQLIRKDGKTIDVAFTVAPLLVDRAEPKQITIVRDVTEEKALQARRDRFLANASHELRTPLTNLITRLYLLRRQPDQFQAHLDVLDKVTAHMKSLVEDLLDVSRFNRGTMTLNRENVRLGPIVQEVVDMQIREAERKHLLLTAHLPDEDVVVFADRKRFIQVLTNLVFNAINYTPSGGAVEVSLSTEVVDGLTFALLRVSDTGVGIDTENLDQIFQPFFRASQEVAGTGLGLAIAWEIVVRHGGEITVESSVGEGTTFTVRIIAVTPETALSPEEAL